MKVLPKQVELTNEDIKRAISYYLTRMGYDEFEVEANGTSIFPGTIATLKIK